MNVLPKILLVFILVTTTHGFQTSVQNDKFVVTLPNTSSVDNFQLVEWSTNLTDWESVARNFGSTWHNTFPNTETLTNLNGATAHERDLTYPQVYYRLSSTSAQSLNNENSISRFLQQATFGPTLDDINNFQGRYDPNLNDDPYTHYATWIQNQLNTNINPITSHRAFFRERSNPGFVANPSAKRNGTSLYEVAYNPTYGPAFNYFSKGNVQFPNGSGNNQYNNEANDLGQVHTFVSWTNPNGNNTSVVEQGRYNDWLANVDSSGALKVYNPNDTWAGGSSIINQKQVIWYTIAIDADDQLRQRMAWALSQIFVIGEEGSKHQQATERFTKYYDVFVRNAFGNYRDILGEVTYHPQMAYYLTYERNTKATSDTFPDENYAREVMQLFTIGLWQLNEDGTFKYANGELIPTYDNENIAEFAKVFTGFDRPAKFVNGYASYIPGLSYPNFEEYQNQNYVVGEILWKNNSNANNPLLHDYTEKYDLDGQPFEHPWGGAGGEAAARADIDYVLDHLFNHPNTPPFVARQLIQRFTVSNPSPTYIYDVVQSFKNGTFTIGSTNFGSGNRGDLEAVIASILLHPEARTSSLGLDQTYGKLREPLIKFMSYARALNIESLNTYGLYPFDNLYAKLAQEPYEYPNVFNFYRPDFQPNGRILDSNLNGPEFQPLTDVTTIGLPNAIHWLINYGIERSTPDTGIGSKWYSQGELNLDTQIAIASDSDDLLNQLDTLITAGRLTPANRSLIKNHIDSMPANNFSQREARVKVASWLFCLTPEFNSIY